MIGDRKVLAVIPARGGSKGLPHKNIMQVGGRPLLAWTVDAARTARHIDRLVLSSDDETIMDAARACGCDVPFRRPAALATDVAPTIDVVLHALDSLPEYEVVVLLQPTSPLRVTADIDAACEHLAGGVAPACVSVTRVEQNPFWIYRLGDDNQLVPVLEPPRGTTRRQELPPLYALNGAVYVAQVDWLRRNRTFVTRETIAHVMPPERSIDIDTLDDFEAFRKAVTENIHA